MTLLAAVNHLFNNEILLTVILNIFFGQFLFPHFYVHNVKCFEIITIFIDSYAKDE